MILYHVVSFSAVDAIHKPVWGGLLEVAEDTHISSPFCDFLCFHFDQHCEVNQDDLSPAVGFTHCCYHIR